LGDDAVSIFVEPDDESFEVTVKQANKIIAGWNAFCAAAPNGESLKISLHLTDAEKLTIGRKCKRLFEEMSYYPLLA
jgi:hypothetical protein